MKIAFAADPLASFKPYKDSTYAMMTEAASRGHTIYAFGHSDLIFDGKEVLANVAHVTLTGQADQWYRQELPVLQPLTEFDVVIERTDPPFNMEYIYATYLLELAESHGARIVNRPEAIRSHNEKIAITGFPQFIAPTLITSDLARLRALARVFFASPAMA
jgi:glutathione synthase